MGATAMPKTEPVEIETIDVPYPKMVVEARVRELLPDGMKVQADVMDAVNKLVAEQVDKAVARCKANGRNTLRGCDF